MRTLYETILDIDDGIIDKKSDELFVRELTSKLFLPIWISRGHVKISTSSIQSEHSLRIGYVTTYRKRNKEICYVGAVNRLFYSAKHTTKDNIPISTMPSSISIKCPLEITASAINNGFKLSSINFNGPYITLWWDEQLIPGAIDRMFDKYTNTYVKIIPADDYRDTIDLGALGSLKNTCGLFIEDPERIGLKSIDQLIPLQIDKVFVSRCTQFGEEWKKQNRYKNIEDIIAANGSTRSTRKWGSLEKLVLKIKDKFTDLPGEMILRLLLNNQTTTFTFSLNKEANAQTIRLEGDNITYSNTTFKKWIKS